MLQLQLRAKLIAPPPFFWPSVAPLACVGEDPREITVEIDLDRFGRRAPTRPGLGSTLPGLQPTTVPPVSTPVPAEPISPSVGCDGLPRLRSEPVLGPGGASKVRY